MGEVMSGIGLELFNIYNFIVGQLPPLAQNFVNLFLMVLFVVAYAIFIWKFYRFIASKNILELNLNKYNRSEHPFFFKLFAGIFYLLEYTIILPFLVFIWFSVFTLFLILLSEGVNVNHLLIASAVIISSIRMTSYYSEDLSRDLAKLLPLTLMAFFIVNFTAFNFQRVIENISQIPSFFENILVYLLFIIFLELILRFFDFIFSLFGLEESDD